MLYHTDSFDISFRGIPLYEKYPELLPFVGNKFGETPKILLLGESHYFPKDSSRHKNPENWYKSSSADLNSDEAAYINTRRVVNNEHGTTPARPKKWKRSRTIFRNIESAMLSAGYQNSDNLFCNVAFMNTFQRPAEEKGGSIRVAPIDVTIAAEVINQVISIIEPQRVIFLSSKASKHLAKKLICPSKVFAHPASAWWYRASRSGVAREQFIKYMAECIGTTSSSTV